MIKADVIYHSGVIYSADQNDSMYSAMAIHDGHILFLGNDESIEMFKDDATVMIDLHGQFVMPGLIDAHLHPFWGASQSLSCDLKHQILSKDEVLHMISVYAENHIDKNQNGWIIVRGWMQSDMLPIGSELTRTDLDAITGDHPIIVFSNDCHVLVCNSLALTLFKTVDVPETAYTTGILEDGPAMQAFDEITRYSDEEALIIAKKAQCLLNQQGVTTVMDARADAVAMKAFQTLAKMDELTLRVLGAKEIPANSFVCSEQIESVIEETKQFMTEFSHVQKATEPTTTVMHIKFFIDGVLQAPLHTALLREPYLIASSNYYGDCYYNQKLLTELLTITNQQGWHVHMHTVGDASIDFALDCIEASQREVKNDNIRASLAHNELTRADHYQRFADLNIIATQSLQWAAMDKATHTIYVELLGKERIEYFECAGRFYDAGIRVAYGSDWPIDHLDLWAHFQVGMNRQLLDDDFKHANDRDLIILEVLRAATIDAAYMLGQEQNIGSLEAEKFADFIILNKNPLVMNRSEIHTIKANQVFLGGKCIKSH